LHVALQLVAVHFASVQPDVPQSNLHFCPAPQLQVAGHETF